jgi:thymidylate synthase (FAD)
VNVLDHGFVEYVDSMGSDALISTIAGISHDSTAGPGVDKLIEWEHFSPLEFGQIIFKVKCPIFVARHIFRHRSSTFNEMSARYVELHGVDFFLPDTIRFDKGVILGDNDHAHVKDSLHHFFKRAASLYKHLRSMGVVRELARIVHPVATYTTFYVRFDLRHLRDFLSLRLARSAQAESRRYAIALYSLASSRFPKTLEDIRPLYEEAVFAFRNPESKNPTVPGSSPGSEER